MGVKEYEVYAEAVMHAFDAEMDEMERLLESYQRRADVLSQQDDNKECVNDKSFGAQEKRKRKEKYLEEGQSSQQGALTCWTEVQEGPKCSTRRRKHHGGRRPEKYFNCRERVHCKKKCPRLFQGLWKSRQDQAANQNQGLNQGQESIYGAHDPLKDFKRQCFQYGEVGHRASTCPKPHQNPEGQN